jgi:hypothetical protein
MAAATTMVVAMSCAGAVPDMAAVIATAGPAIATIGISSEIEIAPRIGCHRCDRRDDHRVSARAEGRTKSASREEIAEAQRQDDARKPQTSPAAIVCSTW